MSPGSDKEPGRGSHGRAPNDITAAKRADVMLSVTDGSVISPERHVNPAVAAKLWRLHWDYGYFTRAEIEAALGVDAP